MHVLNIKEGGSKYRERWGINIEEERVKYRGSGDLI